MQVSTVAAKIKRSVKNTSTATAAAHKNLSTILLLSDESSQLMGAVEIPFGRGQAPDGYGAGTAYSSHGRGQHSTLGPEGQHVTGAVGESPSCAPPPTFFFVSIYPP